MPDIVGILPAAIRGLYRSDLYHAAYGVFHLNRYARELGRCTRRAGIYRLKNTFVRWAYENGYRTECRPVKQVLECWHTRGYAEGWDDYCPKCDNTGIYRQFDLVLFGFDFPGIGRFCWHQPRALVDWPIEYTEDEPGEMRGLQGGDRDHGDGQPDWRLHSWRVWWFLRRNGVRIPPPVEAHGIHLDAFKVRRRVWSSEYHRAPAALYVPWLWFRLEWLAEDWRQEWHFTWPVIVTGKMGAWRPRWVNAGRNRDGRYYLTVKSYPLATVRRWWRWLRGLWRKPSKEPVPVGFVEETEVPF